MSARTSRKTLVVTLMALITALWTSGDLIAQDDAPRTLTILALRCPDGYVGEIPAAACDTPVGDVIFRVGRPLSDLVIIERTDAAGTVKFDIADLPLRGTVRLIEELPAPTATFATPIGGTFSGKSS